jgi:hypothetical protein
MSELRDLDYDDSYPTCAETFSTLRVFSDSLAPEEITKALQIEPTRSFRKGDSHSQGKLQRKANGWFYSTQKLCASKDTRRHIEIILAALEGQAESTQVIQHQGCQVDITSYWVSTGQGGPGLMPEQMLKLGRLGISIWWDVYFPDEDKT